MDTGRAGRAVLAAGLFLCALAAPAHAATPEPSPVATAPAPATAEPSDPLQVVAIEVEPFTMRRDGDQAIGYSMDIWDEIGDRIGLTSKLTWVGDMDELLTAVSSGQADAGIGPISMTWP